MPSGGERITAAIRAATGRNEPAIVGFLTAGYPSREKFGAHLAAVASTADVVEIGVPFTDPMADGMTIQRASHAALRAGVTLNWILSELTEFTELSAGAKTPLLLMSYLNPLLAQGLSNLPAVASRAGVSGFIVPDLPYEENSELKAALGAHGLALVQMVTPVTLADRLETLCAASEGFVYAVTMTGTTGKTVAVPDEVIAYLDGVRAVSRLPVCAGFGIRSRAQVERLRNHVDGVIVGSALVEVLERGEDPGRFLRELHGEGVPSA